MPCFLLILSILFIPYLHFPYVNGFGITQRYILLQMVKKRARDGSICTFKYESTLQFGSIIKFCYAKRQVVAILRVFTLTDQSILDSLRAPTLPEVSKSIA